MPSPMLRLLPWLLLACIGPGQARTLTAKIARVVTPVATLEGVAVRLDWPAQASRGELTVSARRIAAQDLGYRYADVSWHCPLSRDGQGGWRCDGTLRAPGLRPARLSLDLGVATTDAVLVQGASRLELHRQAAAPDVTRIDLIRVPAVWAQALLAQAWGAGRWKAGALDGRLTVESPTDRPLRIAGRLGFSGLGLDTPDGTVAAERLAGDFGIEYIKGRDSRIALDGHLRGGEFLAGNAYLSLPETPIDLRIDARQSGTDGWRLPRFEWRDGTSLQAVGSAAFSSDLALRDLQLDVSSRDIAPLRQRYLSGWLGLAGLGDMAMNGGLDARLHVRDGALALAEANLHGVALRDAQSRFAFESLDGDVRFSASQPVASELRWRSGELLGLDFGAATLPFDSRGGALRLRRAATVPMLGGSVGFDAMELRPPADGAGLRVEFGMNLSRIDFGKVSAALGLPAFTGELSGYLPRARYADDRIDFDGGLNLQLFGGTVTATELSMERPFGVAPTLSADIALDNLDLQALTGVFDFGSISGRLAGRIAGLRLVDWSPAAFDAELHTVPAPGVRQRISQRAVQNISSVGDASFVGSLQGRLIGFFDDFGYARIGISCRLDNEVCEMGGLRSAGDGFTIVEGAGVPRLDVVGFNRRVDWPTLVERLAAVGKGDVKPVFE